MLNQLPTPQLVLLEALLKRIDIGYYAICQRKMRKTSGILINNVYFQFAFKASKETAHPQ